MGMILLIVLMAIAAAYVLIDVLSLPYRWDGALNFKPFSCRTCLSGWLSLPLWSYNGFPVFHIPFLICLTMMACVILNNTLRNYL